MITSSDGNIFRVTGPLCGELTAHRWIPLTKASDAELLCFLWSASWIIGWVNNREAGDFRRHRAHYDFIVITLSTLLTKKPHVTKFLTLFDIETPYGDIDLGQHWLTLWRVAWRRHVIIRYKAVLSSNVFCGMHLRVISQWMSMNLIHKTCLEMTLLTHWGRVTHICVNKLSNIGSDNGLSPDRRQAVIWTNAVMLLIGPLGTNFTEILIGI